MREEFMTFLATYNVIGVTVGLIIATKFGEFTKSLIEDLLTPLIFAPLLKKLKVDKLENLSYKGILYGKVLARSIDFLVIAIFVFIIIKTIGVKM